MQIAVYYMEDIQTQRPARIRMIRIGEISLDREGGTAVRAATDEWRDFIQYRLDHEITHGVTVNWAKRKGSRIIEYSKVIGPSDNHYVGALAEQLFDENDRCGSGHLLASTDEDDKQFDEQYHEVETGVFEANH